MTNWLSDLENRKRKEEEEKQEKEASNKARQEQQDAAKRQLYDRYKTQVDFIHETANPLIARTKEVGYLLDHATNADVQFLSLSRIIDSAILPYIINMSNFNNATGWSRSIEIHLMENGHITLRYHYKHMVKKDVRYEQIAEHGEITMPIDTVTESVIENWIRWIASGEGYCPQLENTDSNKKGFLARLFG